MEGTTHLLKNEECKQRKWQCWVPPPPTCLSYPNVRNYYGPYAHCSLDKGVAYTYNYWHTRAHAHGMSAP